MSLAKLNVTKNKKINGGSMKKLMVSLMLIISMFAFAAESAPSATVGYVKYSNVTTSGTDNNLIALPVDAGYAFASQLDPAGTNLDVVSQWVAASQGWNASNYNAFFGVWDPDFSLSVGQSYMVNAVQNHDLIIDGPVVSIPNYTLVTTSGTDNNLIMHPLTKSSLTTSGAIGTDIGSCDVVSEYIAGSQGWNASNYNAFFGVWDPEFASEIGKPLMVNMTAGTTWPSAKSAEYVEGSKSDPPKGTSRAVYYNCVDNTGVAFSFSAAPYDNVTYKAWITGRETELLQQFSVGCGYSLLSGYSMVYVNVGNFATNWAAGDEINFLVKDETGGLGAYLEGSGSWILDASGSAAYRGVPAMGTGTPISVSTASSIDEMVPVETKLHQNYPNPFNPTTTIKFDLNSDSVVKLNVYNYNGQLVKSLVDGSMKAGYHTVNFDASNLSAGVYYYTMETASKNMTQKMVLVK
jgi:hypothetical protein